MYRKFLDPTTDLTFKKIFGNQQKTEILIAFLNAVLDRKEGDLITKITIIDPNNHPETIISKQTIVDIKCEDQKGITYIIEMQVINQYHYVDRAQYYTCLEVSRQLSKKESFVKLTPVIFVGIANFSLFDDNKDYLTHHELLETKTYKNYLKLTSCHFLELKKFNKNLDELNSIVDQWAFFLKNAGDFNENEIPEQLQENPEIAEAFEVLKLTNYTAQELNLYDVELDALRIEAGKEIQAQELFEQGMKEAALDIAKRMLKKGISIEVASELSGLSIDEIKKYEKR